MPRMQTKFFRTQEIALPCLQTSHLFFPVESGRNGLTGMSGTGLTEAELELC